MEDNKTDDDKNNEEDLDLGPEPEPKTRQTVQPKPKKDRQKITAWSLAALMAFTAVAFAWLYFTKEAATPQQEAEQIGQTEEETDTKDGAETEPSQTVYEAEVGKFRLEFAPAYAVVENLDAGFEGGPATVIEVGQVSSENPGVVVNSPGQAFEIFARPETGATLASNSRTQALEDNDLAEKQADGEFADTAARIYVVDGLFSTTHIVFVKNDIAYEITYLTENGDHVDIFEAVESGFSFVE